MAPTPKLVLEDDQKFALMKLRRNVHDVLQPHHDDRFLVRWLKARSWNVEAAEKMLRESLKCREQWEVDGALKNWEPPEAVALYYPSGVSGYDKDGAPVIIVPFAGLDIIGLLHSATKQDLVRTTIQILESHLGLAAETGANELVVIFDMEGFNLRNYAWRPAAEMVISLIQMYEANYPEILKVCYIINAPRVFSIAFNVVKKFMHEYTISKIHIYKSDPKKWQKVLATHIDPDNLPKYYGGNLVDPDGNPKYTTKIRQGGKIPEKYYTKRLQIDKEDKNFQKVVIRRGDKLTLDFIIAEEGCYLRWEFRTDEHDIRFGISVKDVEGKVSAVIRHRRIAAHQMDESGVLACQYPATYTITFDNSYSLMRNKTLYYHVYVTLPLDQMNILPDENEMNIETTEKI